LEDSSGSRILCFATQGSDHLDGERVRDLLGMVAAESYAFDHAHKLRSAMGLIRAVRRRRPRLIVMEGTGIAGGVAVLAIDALLRIPFIVSSGDAVGPYLRLRSRVAGPLGGAYERALCRRCAGYVGWSPYLVGRALTFGAPRAMTAPGWNGPPRRAGAREEIRAQLGVRAETLLVGLVGSLNWRRRTGYVYGAELVQALRRTQRDDVAVCIVGDGSGLARLIEMAGEELGTRVLLPGRVARERVADYLAAFDLASLPQSVDGVGAFRYSIKISEYLDAELPVITGQIPAAYDLDTGYLWRLPGDAPWSTEYVTALAELLQQLDHEQIAARRATIEVCTEQPFDKRAQQQRMRAFVSDILSRGQL
jgi:glycosyltransferase involved in cell wall biosynthesis